MSRLSELLNPAPTSSSETASTTMQAPPVQPLVLDGQNHRTSSISHGASGSPTHIRHSSITSPGLEALADVASNTAPMASPTQHTTSFAHSTPYQPSYTQYGSRPSSSHATLPPYTSDLTYNSPNQNAPHPSSLEQYHHQSGSERRLSNVTDPSARLPPLQQSPTAPHSTLSADARQPLNGITLYANENLPEQLKHVTSQHSGIEQNSLHSANTPATSQIRQPSPEPSQPLPSTLDPETQSEQIQVKAEIAENPPELPKIGLQPNGQATEGSVTPIKNAVSPTPNFQLEVEAGAASPMATDKLAPLSKPKAPPSKKRAAPKKGTANTVKHAAKKRKLDTDSLEGTPSAQRTSTPSTRRPSNTPVPRNRKQTSITPARSSSIANGPEDEDGSEEDGEAYCICRKPDDHTLMIGCDGPCEDWFHVRCVSMDSVKAKLIFKWYCPNCAEKGLVTLWKRMCRLEGCREPARQDGDNKSKYCCDEHGLEFMKNRVANQSSETKAGERTGGSRRRRRDNYTDHSANVEESAEDDANHIKGGILRPSELKALTDEVKDLKTFRKLGDGVLSPPPTVSPEGDDVKPEGVMNQEKKDIYIPEETAQLEEISVKRETVRAHKKMLDDRDRFLLLVTTRAKAVLSELREQDKSVTTICGYDWRISWSDDEFNEWRASPEGKSALEKGGSLGPPTAMEKKEAPENNENTAPATNGTGDPQPNGEEEEEEIGKGVCKRKRCERHKAWLKLMQQEILFETHQARQAMKKLEAEEKGVRDRAMFRSLEVVET